MTQTVLITGYSSRSDRLTARTFQCIEGNVPINNSMGADAEMLIAIMGHDKRQAM